MGRERLEERADDRLQASHGPGIVDAFSRRCGCNIDRVLLREDPNHRRLSWPKMLVDIMKPRKRPAKTVMATMAFTRVLGVSNPARTMGVCESITIAIIVLRSGMTVAVVEGGEKVAMTRDGCPRQYDAVGRCPGAWILIYFPVCRTFEIPILAQAMGFTRDAARLVRTGTREPSSRIRLPWRRDEFGEFMSVRGL